MVKIYGMPGKVSACMNIPFNSGKANLNVEFSRGCLDRKHYKPATYRTDSEIEQNIIESYDGFGKSIILLKTIGEPKKTVVEQTPKQVEVHDEVDSFESAAAVLKAIPGIKAASLRTPASAKRVAESNGIVFPNYEFE